MALKFISLMLVIALSMFAFETIHARVDRVRLYCSPGCDCPRDDSCTKCCGTDRGYCGEWSNLALTTQWHNLPNTAHGNDFFRIWGSGDKTITVASEPNGGGNRRIYKNHFCATDQDGNGISGLGFDRIRSFKVGNHVACTKGYKLTAHRGAIRYGATCSTAYDYHGGPTNVVGLQACFEKCKGKSDCVAFYYDNNGNSQNHGHCGFCRSPYTPRRHASGAYDLYTMTCDGSNANAAAPGGEICVEEVKNKGCRGYINMDDPRYGKRGGQYSVQDCAAAVKRLDGKEGCKGKKYFFYENARYCNCPRDDCNEGPNNNAGSAGKLYKYCDRNDGAAAGLAVTFILLVIVLPIVVLVGSIIGCIFCCQCCKKDDNAVQQVPPTQQIQITTTDKMMMQQQGQPQQMMMQQQGQPQQMMMQQQQPMQGQQYVVQQQQPMQQQQQPMQQTMVQQNQPMPVTGTVVEQKYVVQN